MMASTAPEIYARDLEPHLPRLSEARIAQQERIIKRQLAWAHEFADRYPALGAGMRVFDTAEDSETTTSFETYLRGEFANTVRLGGYTNLDEAEAAQRRA